MAKVYSRFNRPATEPAPAGDGYAPTYHVELDEFGHKSVVQDGETDLYSTIQSHLEETKIENILAQAAFDPSVLNKLQGAYIDTTDMPTTLMQAQNLVIAGQEEFAKLPANIKQQFNNDVGEYFAKYGSEEWAKILGFAQSDASTATGTVVQNGENKEAEA